MATQEKFFWDTHPAWVMSNNSIIGGSCEGGSGERSSRDKSLCDTDTMKQPEMGEMINGSSGGSKKNDDAFEMKKEIKAEDDTRVSLHNDKAKRKLVAKDHGLHIWTERERRKKMKNMFNQLHALMPQLPQKADKSAVVGEAIRYIKSLHQTLQMLETKKLEKLYGQSTESTITSLIQPQRLSINTTRESFIADQSSSTTSNAIFSSSSLTSLSFPLGSPKLFQTWVSSNVTLNVYGRDGLISICATTPKPGLFTTICFVLEKHKLEIVSAQISSDESKSLFMIHAHAKAWDQFMEKFHYDEIYKLAASEITHWVNSK